MYNQYLDEFGVPDEMNAQIERLNNIAIMKADLIIENKTHLKTMIKVEETRLQMGESAKKKQTLEMNLGMLGKHYGFKLSSKETTTREFYSYLKNIQNG